MGEAPAGLTCLSSLPAKRQDPDSSEEKSCLALPHPVDISRTPDPIYICIGVQPGAGYGEPSSHPSGSTECFSSLQDEFLDFLANKGRNFSFSIFLTQLRG